MKKTTLSVLLCLIPVAALAESVFQYDSVLGYYSRNVVPDEDLDKDLEADEFGVEIIKEIPDRWLLGFSVSRAKLEETLDVGIFDAEVEATSMGYQFKVGHYFPQNESFDVVISGALTHISSDIELSLGSQKYSDSSMSTAFGAALGARIRLGSPNVFEFYPEVGISWDDESEETSSGISAKIFANLNEATALFFSTGMSLDDDNYSYGFGLRIYY